MRAAIRILLGAIGLVVAVVLVGVALLWRSDIPYETLEAKYANSASKFIDLPGGFHVHYRDQGNASGPALLLIHGYGASLHTWEPWVQRLGSKYRMVSVDLPGHGLTRAGEFTPSYANLSDFVVSFADAVGLTRATVVGNSMGGATAWILALRDPELIERLVLVDAAGFEWDSPQAQSGTPILFQILGNPTLAPVLTNLDMKPLIRQTLEAAFYNPALVTDAMVARYADLARAPGHRAILNSTFGVQGAEEDGRATKEKLAKIGVPTLILWGDHDRLIDPADAPKFQSAIPDAKLIVYANAGHIPMEEVADQSASDLDAWLSSTAEPAENP